MQEDIKKNLKNISAWQRLLFMLLFVVFMTVAAVVMTAVIVFQILVNLLTGRSNARALELGQSLARYIYDIWLYLSYNTQERPYPFADWPSGAQAPEPTRSAKPAPKKRRPHKRSSKPKAAPSETAKALQSTPEATAQETPTPEQEGGEEPKGG